MKKTKRKRREPVTDKTIFGELLNAVAEPEGLSIEEIGERLKIQSVAKNKDYWFARIRTELVKPRFVTECGGVSKKTGRLVIKFKVTQENLLNFIDALNKYFEISPFVTLGEITSEECLGVNFKAFRKIVASPFYWKLLSYLAKKENGIVASSPKKYIYDLQENPQRLFVIDYGEKEILNAIKMPFVFAFNFCLYRKAREVKIRANNMKMEMLARRLISAYNLLNDDVKKMSGRFSLTESKEPLLESAAEFDEKEFSEFLKSVSDFEGNEVFQMRLNLEISKLTRFIREYEKANPDSAVKNETRVMVVSNHP